METEDITQSDKEWIIRELLILVKHSQYIKHKIYCTKKIWGKTVRKERSENTDFSFILLDTNTYFYIYIFKYIIIIILYIL